MKTKEEFVEWLKSLPPDTMFCEGLRIDTCPIAKFTGEQAILGCRNDWPQRFMMEYDHGQQNSLAAAIRVAEAL